MPLGFDLFCLSSTPSLVFSSLPVKVKLRTIRTIVFFLLGDCAKQDGRICPSLNSALSGHRAVLNLMHDGRECAAPHSTPSGTGFNRSEDMWLTTTQIESHWILHFFDEVSAACNGHGLIHVHCLSAGQLGWSSSLIEQGWTRRRLPPLRLLDVTWQHHMDALKGCVVLFKWRPTWGQG